MIARYTAGRDEPRASRRGHDSAKRLRRARAPISVVSRGNIMRVSRTAPSESITVYDKITSDYGVSCVWYTRFFCRVYLPLSLGACDQPTPLPPPLFPLSTVRPVREPRTCIGRKSEDKFFSLKLRTACRRMHCCPTRARKHIENPKLIARRR